jgi:cytochrome b pre-mRNA-processing protein 3
MIFGLFRKSADADAVYAVYSAIVAQSRQPRFYADWGVPDTVTGRFDMLCLHMALIFRRLRSAGRESAEFSQALFDLFFRDMDRSLREMGAGDLAVPKKIRKMGNLFYGLLANLDDALDRSDDAALEGVITRNVFAGAATSNAPPLAAYVRAQADRLAALPVASLLAGRLDEVAAA